MKTKIPGLKPAALWKHFFALAAIPHCSKHEAQAAQYVLAQARRLGLPARQDAAGNVVVTKPASDPAKTGPAVVLQGHLDMVCEKNETTAHDFAKEGIKPVRDGDYIRAQGTTLGADNGIGVAAALAVMEAKDLVHGPMEFLFTIDEETGLTGAFQLGADMLSGNRMLNLDSEEEGAVYIGCAGGMDTVATSPVRTVPLPAGRAVYRLKVAGLKGGHSGLDIATGRGNAIKLAARILWTLRRQYTVDIMTLTGGSKRNAIPRETFVTVALEPGQVAAVQGALRALEADIRSELGSADPDFQILFEPHSSNLERMLDAADAERVVQFLYAGPHGVIAMTPDIPNLVQTSTNLAIVELLPDQVRVSMSHRSSVESHKKDVGRMVAAYCAMAGFAVEQGSGYPGWKPNLQSALLKTAIEVHQKTFRKKPEIKAIHAGLECGIIGEKYPGMDMISIGPIILGAHSPDERVSIPSVAHFWKYLKAMLAEL